MRRYVEILLAGFVVVFFRLRDFLCWSLYPEMKVDGKDWDGSNNLTMDLFSAMIFCLAYISWRHTTGILSSILLSALIFSSGDVLDRMFGIRQFTYFDIIVTLIAIILPIYTYVTYRKRI